MLLSSFNPHLTNHYYYCYTLLNVCLSHFQPRSPFFRKLIPNVMSRGIFVGVVTFSGQIELIQNVLQIAFPEYYQRIPIKGSEMSQSNGKIPHMASVAEVLNRDYGVASTRATTLLIDDDWNNIELALCNKVLAVHCNPNDISSTISNLLRIETLSGTLTG